MDLLRNAKSNKTESLGEYDLPDTASSDDMDWQGLATAMNQLSPDHREILRLRYFADLSYDELAESLSIPNGTVMSRLHLARRAFEQAQARPRV